MVRPSVTVCIPTYNGAAHLKECLESVCQQTFQDIEVVVVDDCSADHTADIVSDYQRRDVRVRLFRNERNLGLVANWDRCLSLARADYIKFCFQDDVLYPECINALMSAINRGVRFAFCAREFIFEPGTTSELQTTLQRGRQRISTLFGNEPLIRPELFCKSILAHMPGNIIGEPTLTLMHRDVLTTYGRFNADFLQLIDLEMWCRIAAREPIRYVPDVLARFRVHPGAESSRNREGHLFRAQVVDGVLLAHEFAFLPAFSPLRDIARTFRPAIDLVDVFYEYAYWARQVAADQAPIAGQESTAIDELTTVAAKYPKLLARPPVKYTMARKWRSLKRALRRGGLVRAAGERPYPY